MVSSATASDIYCNIRLKQPSPILKEPFRACSQVIMGEPSTPLHNLCTLSIGAGQLVPVASTGISSYLSKLIPVLVPLNSSLMQKDVLQNVILQVMYLSSRSFLGETFVHSSCVTCPTIKTVLLIYCMVKKLWQ